MKKFFLLSALAAIMSVALVNTSCVHTSGEETEEPFYIVGQWKLQKDYDTYDVHKLNEDGTCTIVDVINDFPGNFRFDGTYKYNKAEGMLYIYDKEGNECYKYEIVNISKNSKNCEWVDKIDPKKKSHNVIKR